MTVYINPQKNKRERFNIQQFMELENDHYDIFESYFIDKLMDLPVKGYFKITSEVLRPDLISQKIYQSDHMAWIILQYNNVQDFTKLQIGQELKYPRIEDLNILLASLKGVERKNR